MTASTLSAPPMHVPRPHRIAVVEDDHHLRHDLLDFLNWKGFDAQGCESAEAFDVLHGRRPVDLVLLDIGLAGRSGLVLARELRALPQPPGIVMLTSFGTDADHISGLAEGADAYLVKGSSLELIMATCQSVLRRLAMGAAEAPPGPALPVLATGAGPWHLHVAAAELRAPDGQRIGLTHMECVFLHHLMTSPGQAVARGVILDELGKPGSYNSLRNLDNCATRLRRKVLQGVGQELPVRSCYGQGYAFGGLARIVLT